MDESCELKLDKKISPQKMIKKIVLINPPQIFSKTQVAAGVVPPLGIMYLAAVCKKENYQVKIIDSVVEAPFNITKLDSSTSYRGLSIEEIAERCKDADLIGISNLFSFAFPLVTKLVDKIKSVTSALIVVGGAHISATPEYTLKNSKVDFVIMGEGEAIFLDLISFLNKKKNISSLHSIAYKKNKKIVVKPRKSYIEYPDALPFPARELVPLEKYFVVHEAHGPSQGKWTPILASRGCPFECTFCTSALWGRRWRARSVKNIVNEIGYCVKEYGITEFHFEDENITLDKKRMLQLCNEILKRNLNIKWQTPNGIRVGMIDKETLIAMKKSGCNHIVVAPESGSTYVLNNIIRKHQDLEKVSSFIKIASSLRLKTAAYFVMGLPGEKVSDIQKTLKFANKLARIGLDEIAFSIFIPLPGSVLFEKLRKQNKITGEWIKMTAIGDITKAVSWSDHVSSKELLALRTKGYILFHLNKALFHPVKSLHFLLNLIQKKETLKTERVIIAFIKRLFR